MRHLRRLLPLAGLVNAVWLAWWSIDAVIQARRWATSARQAAIAEAVRAAGV